jgi:hypothetical protein
VRRNSSTIASASAELWPLMKPSSQAGMKKMRAVLFHPIDLVERLPQIRQRQSTLARPVEPRQAVLGPLFGRRVELHVGGPVLGLLFGCADRGAREEQLLADVFLLKALLQYFELVLRLPPRRALRPPRGSSPACPARDPSAARRSARRRDRARARAGRCSRARGSGTS